MSCPNSEQKKSRIWKIMENINSNLAILAFNGNNGYLMDKLPTGRTSPLFSKLEKQLSFDEAIAIKMNTFTYDFKMNYEGEYDENGEPEIDTIIRMLSPYQLSDDQYNSIKKQYESPTGYRYFPPAPQTSADSNETELIVRNLIDYGFDPQTIITTPSGSNKLRNQNIITIINFDRQVKAINEALISIQYEEYAEEQSYKITAQAKRNNFDSIAQIKDTYGLTDVTKVHSYSDSEQLALSNAALELSDDKSFEAFVKEALDSGELIIYC